MSGKDNRRLARFGALMSGPPRTRMLTALLDGPLLDGPLFNGPLFNGPLLDGPLFGHSLPASVLAAEAGVVPSTASRHLAKLVDGGLSRVERRGRFRHYRLAGGDVDGVPRYPHDASSLPAASVTPGVSTEDSRECSPREARSCWDHLGGRLGTALLAAGFREECGISVRQAATVSPGRPETSLRPTPK